jgi:hypothetical protein
MSYQDYIVRQIALFARVLSRVLGLAREERYDEALDAVEAALRALAGEDPDAPIAKTAWLPRPFPEATTTFEEREKAMMTSRLLREAAAIHAARGEARESYASTVQALDLMLAIHLNGRDVAVPEYAPTVDALHAELSDYVLPNATAEMLVHYYEQTGAYARAENVLFDLLDTNEDPQRIADTGAAFFTRLMDLSDSELEAGGLSRDEVQAGLEDLSLLT